MMNRSKKCVYNKRYVDAMFKDAILKTCVVSMKKFTAKDMENYKLSLIQNKNNTLNEDVNISKDDKTSKNDKRSKYNKKSKDVETSEDVKAHITVKTSKDDKTSKDVKTPEDVKTSKDVKTSEDYNTSIDDEPAKKKQKLNTNGKDVLKLVLSRDGETHKFRSKFKSSLIPESKVKQEPNYSTSTENSTVPRKMLRTISRTVPRVKQEPSTENITVPRTMLRSISRAEPRVKQEPSTENSTVPRSVSRTVPRTVSCTVTSNVLSTVPRTVSCTVTSNVPIIETDCKDSTESTAPANSSTNKVKPLIWIADCRKMMTDEKHKKWLKIVNTGKNIYEVTNGTNHLAVDKPSTSEPNSNGVERFFNGKDNIKGQFIKYENLYKKYFSKFVQDSIVIIANTLNIISISKQRFQSLNKTFDKKKTEAEKLKERCDAYRLHERHYKVLRTKLRGYFTGVVSLFTDLEFHSAFQLFFLGILSVIRVLDQPKLKKGSIFKKLVTLLSKTLSDTNYRNEKVYEMFREKNFRTDCIDVISLIEDSRDVDPGVINRMSLFFVSTESSLKHFQPLINAVTRDSKEDLEVLIEQATYQTRAYSQLKDPVASSTVQELYNKTPEKETIQIPVNSDGTIQEWFLAKNPDGTYQQIPVKCFNKSKTIGNIAAESSNVTSQTLNNLYESFSSTIPKNTHKPSTSNTIPSNKCFVDTPNIPHVPLMQVTRPFTLTTASTSTTTFVGFNPSFQNKKPMENISLIKVEGGTFVVDNKQLYQLVNVPPSQMRATANGTNNILVTSPQTDEGEKCSAKNCNLRPTLKCGSCSSAKYCSVRCQNADWYNGHENKCDQGSINKM